MEEKNQTVAFGQSNLDDLKEIAGRLTSCRVMLSMINAEVKAAMPVECNYSVGAGKRTP